MLQKVGERNVSGLWNLIGKLVHIFQPFGSAQSEINDDHPQSYLRGSDTDEYILFYKTLI